MDLSLYHRLGGEHTVHAAANLLYSKIATQSEIAQFFSGINLAQQEQKLVSFLTIVLQGKTPEDYAPEILRKSHAPLVEQGLNDIHYDQFVVIVKDTLIELDVPKVLIEELMDVIESFRGDVLQK